MVQNIINVPNNISNSRHECHQMKYRRHWLYRAMRVTACLIRHLLTAKEASQVYRLLKRGTTRNGGRRRKCRCTDREDYRQWGFDAAKRTWCRASLPCLVSKGNFRVIKLPTTFGGMVGGCVDVERVVKPDAQTCLFRPLLRVTSFISTCGLSNIIR
jgi:hypothetical protein